MLPIYMYEHSGIALNTTGFSCNWDSGQLGFIYVTKEKVRECFKVKKVTKKILKLVEENLISEIETYSKYINGEGYYWATYNEDNEIEDSCGGYYSEEDALVDGRASLNYLKKEVDQAQSPSSVSEASPNV